MRPTVPSIDFKPFLHGSAGDRQLIASEIDEALGSVGFIQLHNHGIEQHKVDDCFQWSKRLFALSESGKGSIRPSSPSRNRGYSGIGNEKIRDTICMKENFNCGNPKDLERDNSWPTEELLPGFRHFTEDFYQDCAQLIHQLLQCLSLALNLSPKDSLGQYHDSSLFDLSFIHYPTVSLPSGGLTRNPAHSDFGTLTLLFQDEVGGLEVADTSSTNSEISARVERSGSFVHVDPKPGTILVNVGYLLMRWSNGHWKNTIHRVSEPPHWKDQGSADAIPERYSIAYFSAPDPATVVEALPCCCGDQAPKRWKSVNAGDYLRRKRAALYAQEA